MKTLRRISNNRAFTHLRMLAAVLLVVTAAALVFLAVSPPAAAQPSAGTRPAIPRLTPKFLNPVAFDVSPALSNLPRAARPLPFPPGTILEVRPERRGSEGPRAHRVRPYRADGARQLFKPELRPSPLRCLLSRECRTRTISTSSVSGLILLTQYGDVGPNHYVEMINLVFAIYDKAGNLLLGPVDTGSLWAGFPIEDCTDPSGDPVVIYDQTTDHWLLTQFTTRGLDDPTLPFYNCVAVSQTGDPTGRTIGTLSSRSQTTSMVATSPRLPEVRCVVEFLYPHDTGLRVDLTGTGSASTRSRRTRWLTASRTHAQSSSSWKRT